MKPTFFGLLIALAAATPTHAGPYTFTTLSVPGALPSYFGTKAFGINVSGQVVGTYTSVDSLQGFVFDQASATYTTFDNPASTTGTVAQGINDLGQIVGYTPFTANQIFLRDPTSGAFTSITNPAGEIVQSATGINNAGQILSSTTNGNNFSPAATSFLRDPVTGGYTYLQDPNSGSQSMPNVTLGSGINNTGQVVGYFQDVNSAFNGFILDPATNAYTTLSYPGAINTMIQGINNSGQVVGYYDNNQVTESFVLDLATGAYTTLSDPDAVATYAKGINDSGQIVGYFTDISNVPMAFLATPSAAVPVPEPGSMALLAISVLGLGIARHWRTKSG